MRQAQSRLKQTLLSLRPNTKPRRSKKKSGEQPGRQNLLKSYWQHLPTLVVGLIFAFITFLILTRIEPMSIKHFLLPHTYLPLLASVFVSSWFLLSFFLLNTRRGLLLSLALITLLFLKLQQVVLTTQVMLSVIIPLLLLEFLLTFIIRVGRKT